MLQEQINKDYIDALKQKNTIKSSTLNFLRAQLKNVAIEKKKDVLDDAEVIIVIKKQVKQRQDSIEQFEKGGRADLAQKERAELDILKVYLPQELSEEEILTIVRECIKEVSASSVKDMGKVMKLVISRLAGRADNKKVSKIVRNTLLAM